VISGRHYRTGKGVRLELEGPAISSVRPSRGARAFVAPGLVDLQVNGFRGMDFNRLPIAPDLPGRITRELWSVGVTSYCPTLITNRPNAISEGLRCIARACRHDSDAGAGIAGVHLEGPFISPEDGARGAHDRRHVRKPDFDLVRRWTEDSDGLLEILTMSPEWPNSPRFIERCVEAGLQISIGHTSATPEQVRDAVKAGASLSTHFGNGAHPVLPRHPNYLWEQLAADGLAACLIADGHHVPDSLLKVVLKVKGPAAYLVSDSVYLAGMKPGRYRASIGGQVVLTREGRLHLAKDPRLLAGSASPLLLGVAHLVRTGLADPGEAWERASTGPASCLGLAVAKGLVRGAPADAVVLEVVRGSIRLLETWKSGRKVWSARRT
jgi:N-acetylglucosamine-6-phosphate deacetylase